MNPNYMNIGNSFVQAYYSDFDSAPSGEQRALKLINYYHNEALMIFEDDSFQGKEAIANKIKMLPFVQVGHALTKVDCQPLLDGGVLIMVTGQVKTDEDRPHGFAHVFVLRDEGGSFSIMHEIFRLSIHNI